MTWLHRQTDEHVGVPLSELAVVVEVEVPRSITIGIGAVADGGVMATQTRKGDTQGNTHTIVDRQIVASRRGYGTDSESCAAQPFAHAPLWKQMLLNSIHDRFDVG